MNATKFDRTVQLYVAIIVIHIKIGQFNHIKYNLTCPIICLSYISIKFPLVSARVVKSSRMSGLSIHADLRAGNVRVVST